MNSVNQWLSLLSFILVISLFGLVSYLSIVLFFKNRKQMKIIAQLILDNQVIANQLADYMAQKTIEESDGFLRFVTQSRDWAFEYIEDVQEKLNNFVEQVGPTLAYYDKYGRINENESMNKIFDAYTELIKVLPESNENKEK